MPEFFAQNRTKERDVEKLRTIADSLRQYGQQTPNEMVSGIVVKKSPIEALAKALGTAGAGYYEGKARRAEDDLVAQRNAQLAAVLSGSSPELQQLAALNPELALKTYADDIKRTNEMKNAQWMGISPEEKAHMERQSAYEGAIDKGAAFGGFDAQGRPIAQPVMMPNGQTRDAYQIGLEGQKADITERTKAAYDVMQPQQVLNPATGQYETRAMTRADAAAMASGAPSRNYIMTQAAERGVNPAFADALYGAETNYGQNMGPSSAGAIGPLQTMPQTLQDPGFGVQPARDNSIDEQTRVGLDYMAAMKQRYNNNPIDAAVAYNWGPGNADKWIQSGRDPNALPAETRDYVQKIMQGMQQAPQMPGYQVKPEQRPEINKLNENFITSSLNPAVEQARGAQEANARIEALRNIDLTGKTGWGTETKAAAANILAGLGMASEDAKRFATDAQTFKSIVSKQVNEELMLQKGPQTEGDAQRAFNIQAQLGNTPEANQFILDLAQATNNQKIKRAEFFTQNAGRENMYQLEGEWSKQAQSVFDDPTMQKYKNIEQNYQKSVAQNDTRTIGDKTYVNIGGQWFEQ